MRGMSVTMVTFKYSKILVVSTFYVMTLAYSFETGQRKAVPVFAIVER